MQQKRTGIQHDGAKHRTTSQTIEKWKKKCNLEFKQQLKDLAHVEMSNVPLQIEIKSIKQTENWEPLSRLDFFMKITYIPYRSHYISIESVGIVFNEKL